MLIIKVAKGEGNRNWLIKVTIKEIWMLMEYFQEIHVAHLYQEGNGVVDGLDKFGNDITHLVEWDDIRRLPSSNEFVMERECTFINCIWINKIGVVPSFLHMGI